MRIAIAAVCVFASNVCVNAEEKVLAIAYCPDNRAVGVSVKISQSSAAEFALKNCLVSGGGVACCHLEIVLTKAQCGAIAANKANYGRGTANTQQEANENAKASCGYDDCRVVASRCR